MLQSGRGGGLAGVYGGGGWSSGSVFGGRGATAFLTKLTTVLGLAFAASTLILHLYLSRTPQTKSVIREKAGEVAPMPVGDEEEIPSPDGVE